jgi:hypothetical protein
MLGERIQKAIVQKEEAEKDCGVKSDGEIATAR